jgi:hypothetical protein
MSQPTLANIEFVSQLRRALKFGQITQSQLLGTSGENLQGSSAYPASNEFVTNFTRAVRSGQITNDQISNPSLIGDVGTYARASNDFVLECNRAGAFGQLISIITDSDATAYLAAVQAADGQILEDGVRAAINTFVIGLKSDGLWDSIVTSCIMAGARTVAGAIVPLRGNAPTNNNFVSGDYSRKLGLLGNGTNKYLATGYNNDDTTNFPQDNSHMSCYITAAQTNGGGTFVGGTNSTGARFSLHYSAATSISTRNRASTSSILSLAPIGFQANSRNNSAGYTRRFTTASGPQNANIITASSAPTSELLGVLSNGAGTFPSDARMSFYSIGKSIDLVLFDTRVTTLMTTLSSVIP